MTDRLERVLFGWKSDWRFGCETGARQAGFTAAMQPLALSNLSHFDAIVPLTLDDQAFIDSVRAAGCNLPAIVTPAAQREICHDKLVFGRLMTGSGLGGYVPETYELGGLKPDNFPLVVKQRKGEYGYGSTIVNTSEELEQHRPAVLSGHAFLQEYIPGTEECAAHLLVHQGKIVYSSVMHYEFPIAGISGHALRPVKCSWVSQDHFDSLWNDILLKLGIHTGTVCIDYRVRADQPVIFEINPRVGASLTWNMKNYILAYMRLVH